MHHCNLVLLFITIGLTGIHQNLTAQPSNETISKVITKDFPCAPSDIFTVAGEKATIHVTGWKNNYIQARITFSSTHPDKAIASHELDFMRYSLSREKNMIELRNTFILPSSKDYIQSKLEVIIELKVPLRNQLSVTNKYGNVEISNMTGKTSVYLEFSDINLADISGEVTLQAYYSEVRGHNIHVSSFKCRDEESRVIMDVSSGHYTFNSKHSGLDLTLRDILALKIDSKNTDITITPIRFDTYQYTLENKEGKIYIPAEYSNQLKKEGKRNTFLITGKPSKPLVQISTTFNTITINKNL
jgi:hypothetical protein